MRWYEKQRVDWIREHVMTYGHVNREDVVKKFLVTEATVSKDFRTVQDLWPNLVEYNRSTKRYELSFAAAPAVKRDVMSYNKLTKLFEPGG